jgi:23S rRNA pseudouridine1911/1915/1917 synthase
MTQKIELSFEVLPHQAGLRLDQALADQYPDYSRSRLKSWILADYVAVDSQIMNKPRHKVMDGQMITVCATLEDEVQQEPEAIELNIVYEDEHILVINKPVGLVVHPGAGNQNGTLLNALLHHVPHIEKLPRAGIVHRLDKDTSGLMVVAKTLPAHTRLIQLLQAREIVREYEAIAQGLMTAGGKVDKKVGRHPTKRTHMAVVPQGKEAVTHYRVIHKYRAHTHIRLRLETGRTHQIRVHMAYINHPLVGDPAYGGRPRPIKGMTESLKTATQKFRRQALHAALLSFEHPHTGEVMTWQADLPDDMKSLLHVLHQDLLELKSE